MGMTGMLARHGGLRVLRMPVRIALCLSLGAMSLSSALLIQYQVSVLDGDLQRYNYSISGITLQTNQELDIRFDPALYGSLSNGVAPEGFDLLLLQPNNPPGTFGDYSALALVDDPPLSGEFRVDFTYIGGGTPGSQPFLINQYDEGQQFVATIASGTTVAAVPEPTSFALFGVSLVTGAIVRAVRRHPPFTAE
jgi:hypothetical protein